MALELSFKRDIFKDIAKRIGQSINKGIGPNTMKLVGNLAIEQIRNRTRRGWGLSDDGTKQKKFKALDKDYVAYKKKQGFRYTGRTAKLSATGEMLDSMFIKTRATGQTTISFRGVRNSNLASYHDRLGVGQKGKNIRKFFGLTTRERARIANLVGKQIVKNFKL